VWSFVANVHTKFLCVLIVLCISTRYRESQYNAVLSLLTYDLWERLVQDLIYLAHNVCFRDDWAEETMAQVAQAFH
jgi:hypothetical protein